MKSFFSQNLLNFLISSGFWILNEYFYRTAFFLSQLIPIVLVVLVISVTAVAYMNWIFFLLTKKKNQVDFLLGIKTKNPAGQVEGHLIPPVIIAIACLAIILFVMKNHFFLVTGILIVGLRMAYRYGWFDAD